MLSSYLFVLAMKTLSCFLRRPREGVFFFFFTSFKVNGRDREGLEVSHLSFASDKLVVCEASHFQMTYLSWLLMWFEAILSLKINLTKNELILVWRVEDLEDLAFDVGCKVGVLPTTYLGLLLGASHNSLAVWDGVEERFHERLAMWKRQYISKGERLMLIRGTLASLPIYFISLFRMLRLGCLRMEKIKRIFFGEVGP